MTMIKVPEGMLKAAFLGQTVGLSPVTRMPTLEVSEG